MWFYFVVVVVVLFLQALRCQDPQADNNDAFQTRTSNCLAVISLLFKTQENWGDVKESTDRSKGGSRKPWPHAGPHLPGGKEALLASGQK